MFYTFFGWLNMGDWQIMLDLGFFYGIPCDVQLTEEDITGENNEDDTIVIDDDDGGDS